MSPSNEPSLLDYFKSLFSRGEAISVSKATAASKSKSKPKGKRSAAKSPAKNGPMWEISLSRRSRNLIGITVIALSTTLIMIPRLERGASYIIPILAWLLAIFLFPQALGYQISDLVPAFRAIYQRNREIVLPLSILTLVALIARFWGLSSIPFVLSGDEAAHGREAVRVISGNITNPFETGWTSVPTMTFYMLSLPIRLFGQSIFALRAFPALLGALTIPVTFFLMRRLANQRLAWLVAGLLAVYHYHIHFSRLGSNMVLDPLFAALALFFLHRALSGKSIKLDWILLGFSIGLAFYFYTGARFVLILVVAILLYNALLNPREFLRRHSPGILIGLAAFLISAGPMIQLALRFPDIFNGRVNQVGILQNGWLENEVIITGKTKLQLLGDQLRRATLAFNFYPDRTVWYGLKTPLLNPFFGALMFLGVGFASLRLLLPKSDPNLAYMVAWFWGPVLSGGMLTVDPPSSMRLITLAIPACFFIALVIQKMVQIAQGSLSKIRPIMLFALVFIAFAISSLNMYFRTFSPLQISGGPRAEFATITAPILAEYVEEFQVIFLGQPFMTWNFDTFPYLLPGTQAIEMPPNLDLTLAEEPLSQGRGVVFVILPERQNDLSVIQARFPTGRVEQISTESEWNSLSTLYFVESN